MFRISCPERWALPSDFWRLDAESVVYCRCLRNIAAVPYLWWLRCNVKLFVLITYKRLKFFSALRFQTAFIFETTVWNHSSVRDCTGLRFETAFLFASSNLSVNHPCVSTPRIVYDSICDTRLVFASWHRKRLGPRQATGASCVLLWWINY